jgi:hypothetical protein
MHPAGLLVEAEFSRLRIASGNSRMRIDAIFGFLLTRTTQEVETRLQCSPVPPSGGVTGERSRFLQNFYLASRVHTARYNPLRNL